MCFQIEKYLDKISNHNKCIFVVCLFVLYIKIKLLVVLDLSPHLEQQSYFFVFMLCLG